MSTSSLSPVSHGSYELEIMGGDIALIQLAGFSGLGLTSKEMVANSLSNAELAAASLAELLKVVSQKISERHFLK